jgi:uncharacterized protein (DUF433 family)
MIKCPSVSSDPEVMHGAPVFSGTRVPVQTLFDHLEAEQPLSEFFEDFPSVRSDQVTTVLEYAQQLIVERTYESVA